MTQLRNDATKYDTLCNNDEKKKKTCGVCSKYSTIISIVALLSPFLDTRSVMTQSLICFNKEEISIFSFFKA